MGLGPRWLAGAAAGAGALVVAAAVTGTLLTAENRADGEGGAPKQNWSTPSPMTGPTTPPPEGARPPQMPDLPPRLQAQLRKPPGSHSSRRGAGAWLDAIPFTRWDPCQPLEFVINPDDAPPGAVDDFAAAVYKVDQSTDLTLEITGTTDVADPAWGAVPGRPVLVNWGPPGHGVLQPRSAATSEPVGWLNYDGEKVYAAGQITFNTRADQLYLPGNFGFPGSRIALYMHEIAHILGLGHVQNPHQLMYPDPISSTDFGAGDLAGLREVTSGPCLRPPDPDETPSSSEP